MTDKTVIVELDSVNFYLSDLIEENPVVMFSGTGILHCEGYAPNRFSFKKVKNQKRITLDLNRHTDLWRETTGQARENMVESIKQQCNTLIKQELVIVISNLKF